MLIDQLGAWDIADWTDVLTGGVIAGVEPYDVRIKHTPDGDEPLLLIVKAYNADGAPLVAFHAGRNVLDILAGAMRRMRNGTIKWRNDDYANPRNT